MPRVSREPVPARTEHLRDVHRLVVKVGTRGVADVDGSPNELNIQAWAQEIAGLIAEGREVLLVTSGAVYMGFRALGLDKPVDALRLRQAGAAVGQPLLMRYWRRAFQQRGLVVAQILLTQDDVADRRRAIHLRNTIFALLEAGAIPIFNENDSVSVDGVTFMDNDRLAARLAGLIGADFLILLTDQNGLFTRDPDRHQDARLVSLVRQEELDAAQFVEDRARAESRGGMKAKVRAAEIAVSCGIPCALAHGGEPQVIQRLLHGEDLGTFFVPRERVSSRKSWILSGQEPSGEIFVDGGACRALQQRDGSSLLPVGITDARGEFASGDLVILRGPDGAEIARGLVNYAAHEVRVIKGSQTRDIARLLGRSAHETVVHRDNMVVTAPRNGSS